LFALFFLFVSSFFIPITVVFAVSVSPSLSVVTCISHFISYSLSFLFLASASPPSRAGYGRQMQFLATSTATPLLVDPSKNPFASTAGMQLTQGGFDSNDPNFIAFSAQARRGVGWEGNQCYTTITSRCQIDAK
jgi:hypothetical protein